MTSPKKKASGRNVSKSERHTVVLQLRVHPALAVRMREIADTYDLALSQVLETALDVTEARPSAYVAALGLPESVDEYARATGRTPSDGALEVARRLRTVARAMRGRPTPANE